MDVNSNDFQRLAPSILDAVANAHFVTLDLELSGIPGQQPNRTKVGEGSSGKPTLQQRYAELKIAAETYQVLQLGLTCVIENEDRGSYTIRPYNFYVNPVPDGRLDVERIFSFQGGALEFLLSHKFRIDAPFLEGIPYFSRAEEVIARSIALARQKKQETNIGIKDDDAESRGFIDRIRTEIDEWLKKPSPKPSYINIAPVGHSSPTFQDRGLNNFQKRLVHQFVRSEYPELVTIGRAGFIQVLAYNKEREDSVQKARNAAFEDKLTRQIGLRWLVEGMVGGDLTPIIPWNFQPGQPESKDSKALFVGLFDRLKEKRTVLVGHNVFIDLIYFYACFFGKLPDQVEEFQRTIHDLFPVVVDTKYLATHSNDNPALLRSSLEDLDLELSRLSVPLIETHPEHRKYTLARPAHEAGFDSYLTAKILIRIATKLKPSHHAIHEKADPALEEEDYETAPEDESSSSSVPPTQPPAALKSLTETPTETNRKTPSRGSSSDGVPLPIAILAALPQKTPSPTTKKPKRKPPPNNNSAPKKPTAFSHSTKFDLLADHDVSDEDLIDLSSQPSPSKPIAANGRVESKKVVEMMPRFEDEFWLTYGNRLRVNGTVEGICCLNSG